MIGLPRIEFGMKRAFVVEIAVAPVDGQDWRGDRHEDRARAAFHGLMPLAWRNDDDLMSEPRRRAQLGVDVGPDPAAAWCVESANVDNPHGRTTADNAH